jgi:hypothetical protein
MKISQSVLLILLTITQSKLPGLPPPQPRSLGWEGLEPVENRPHVPRVLGAVTFRVPGRARRYRAKRFGRAGSVGRAVMGACCALAKDLCRASSLPDSALIWSDNCFVSD